MIAWCVADQLVIHFLYAVQQCIAGYFFFCTSSTSCSRSYFVLLYYCQYYTSLNTYRVHFTLYRVMLPTTTARKYVDAAVPCFHDAGTAAVVPSIMQYVAWYHTAL